VGVVDGRQELDGGSVVGVRAGEGELELEPAATVRAQTRAAIGQVDLLVRLLRLLGVGSEPWREARRDCAGLLAAPSVAHRALNLHRERAVAITVEARLDAPPRLAGAAQSLGRLRESKGLGLAVQLLRDSRVHNRICVDIPLKVPMLWAAEGLRGRRGLATVLESTRPIPLADQVHPLPPGAQCPYGWRATVAMRVLARRCGRSAGRRIPMTACRPSARFFLLGPCLASPSRCDASPVNRMLLLMLPSRVPETVVGVRRASVFDAMGKGSGQFWLLIDRACRATLRRGRGRQGQAPLRGSASSSRRTWRSTGRRRGGRGRRGGS